ncbi:CDP-diacylglycerol--serine O-phosphatidyltransferase [Desulfovibrio sp. ZJ369]|uniref:CDP-diacylglycerol--serine O-phosphatidyltransferase n=1 Tax=Desulfovibrio sp. ZJ369 TaxID=2709793 RepID=UPI0013EC7FF7|nr:CDP-diacylglycerol--serine O-phosphatidyltransferase [Desulfovibrio sp. ZJ369]
MEKKKPHKGVYLLPNMITTLSMFLGFLSMVWAVQGRFEAAGMAILLSALMDGLDGKVARLTNTASEFGVQYDSLADLVAFGLAPAMLLWQWQLEAFGRLGVAAAFIYAACGALRLARFNVSTAAVGKRFFIGLPIPAGGCTVVTFVFFASLFPGFLQPLTAYLALLLAVGAGILMVSRVRYFSFKEYDFLRAHPIRTMIAFLFILALVVSLPRLMGFVLCALYIAGGLVYTFVMLPRRNRQLLRALSPQSE